MKAKKRIGTRAFKIILLRDYGVNISEGRILRLLKSMTLPKMSTIKPRFKSNHSTVFSSDNLLKQEFNPKSPNKVWTTDFTYISIGSRHCYLSTIMDRYTKKNLAWNFGKRMTEELIVKTFNRVIAKHELSPNAILHSDQGSQYTGTVYENLLKDHQVRHSFSRKGYPYHNASLESWHGHIKNEWIYQHQYETFDEDKQSIFWYIEAFYNRHRIYQTLGYLIPDQFEAQIAYFRKSKLYRRDSKN